jgi:hypothetical protein
MVPLCLMWTVWKEQNRRTFENEEITTVDLATIFCTRFLSGPNVFTQHVSLLDFFDK